MCRELKHWVWSSSVWECRWWETRRRLSMFGEWMNGWVRNISQSEENSNLTFQSFNIAIQEFTRYHRWQLDKWVILNSGNIYWVLTTKPNTWQLSNCNRFLGLAPDLKKFTNASDICMTIQDRALTLFNKWLVKSEPFHQLQQGCQDNSVKKELFLQQMDWENWYHM